MSNKRARPSDEESTNSKLHELAAQAGLDQTTEKQLSSVEFKKCFIVYVQLVLISGVGSSCTTLNERRETWISIMQKNGHTHRIPTSKSLRRMIEEADTEKTLYLWSGQEANSYILRQFSPKGSALVAMEALGMEKGVKAGYGSYRGVIDTLCAKNEKIKQFLFEKFDGEPEIKKIDFVAGLSKHMNKLVNEKSILLSEWHKSYKEVNKCVDSYTNFIETVSTREIEALSNGELVSVTSGSDYDIARVSRESAHGEHDATSDLPVTLHIELKQSAKPSVHGKQFQMTFHKPFKHNTCAGVFLLQFIGKDLKLSTFAVLTTSNIELLREAAGGRQNQNVWSVSLSELEWTDDENTIRSFKFNNIFNSVLEKLVDAGRLFKGEDSLADAVKWLLALPIQENLPSLHSANSTSANIKKGNIGEWIVRTCLLKVLGKENIEERKTDYELITGNRADLIVRINGGDPYSFSSKTVCKLRNSFYFPMTHSVKGRHQTPFTLESACDVLCASATAEVVADLVKKFGASESLPQGTIALFVFPKSIICDPPKTLHTITATCWQESCILMSEDCMPLDLDKAKLIFEKAFSHRT
jgi:hypothetical protein